MELGSSSVHKVERVRLLRVSGNSLLNESRGVTRRAAGYYSHQWRKTARHDAPGKSSFERCDEGVIVKLEFASQHCCKVRAEDERFTLRLIELRGARC